jgi:glycine oxidase
MSTDPTRDVVIVGGGIIGLASAWRLAEAGLTVTIIDPDPAGAATHVAAGMLAPVSEIEYGEEDQLELALASLQRYPQFVTDLERASGQQVGLRREGTLIVATDAGDRELLVELHAFQEAQGLTARLLSSRECRAVEPMLSPEVRCGLLVESDHSVDNRQLAAALLTTTRSAGVTVVPQRVASICVEAGAVTGVELADGSRISGATVLLAAGPWSGEVPGLPPEVVPPVRPVKGQILRLRAANHVPLPTRTVRGLVNGHDIYLVPRTSGELVVGATLEEVGFDTVTRAGGVRELLRDARTVMPAIDELELVESSAALRPGSPDNRPMIGRTSLDGLVVATGHHRNGILLAPITADLVCAAVTGSVGDAEARLLALTAPNRFQRVEAPA